VMDKLLPCPFCGDIAALTCGRLAPIQYVTCGCGAFISFRGNESKEGAIKAYNTRHNGWIKFELMFDEDYGREILTFPLPDDEQEILVTDGKDIWEDIFLRDGGDCCLDSGFESMSRAKHWMPLPQIPKRRIE